MPLLFGAGVLLLVLVCINTASLLGQRAARRRREIAIRTSLGATSRRIARQVFIESFLLAAMGGVVGWAASLILSKSLYLLLPNFGLPVSFNLSTDARILLFVALIVMVVALLCGMMPVRQALRVSQRDALHEGSQGILGGSRNRIAKIALLGLQLGLCFVVLVGSALLMRTLINVLHRATGFDREDCLTTMLSLGRSGYSKEKGLAFQTALLDELRAAPGVRGVTLTSHLPMGDWGSGNTWGFEVPGYTPAKDEGMSVITDLEGPEFFRTMAIGLSAGREFSSQDREGGPLVAMVNEDMARRYFPKGNALGSTVLMGKEKQACQIVGIVEDYAYHNPQNVDPTPVRLPSSAAALPERLVCGSAFAHDGGSSAARLRQAVAKLDGALPLQEMQTLKQVSEVIYQFALDSCGDAGRVCAGQPAGGDARPLCGDGLRRDRADARVCAAHGGGRDARCRLCGWW